MVRVRVSRWGWSLHGTGQNVEAWNTKANVYLNTKKNKKVIVQM